MPKPHTVLLVEDDPRTRDRLAGIVRGRPELALDAAVGSLSKARAAIARRAPDVLLTDLGLPDGDGTELIREVLASHPETLCMVITVFGDERHVIAALQAGALGYLLKDRGADQLSESIREMLEGGSPISAAIARHVLRQLPAAPAASGAPAGGGSGAAAPDPRSAPALTEREHEVLRLVVKGFNKPEIARLLGVSSHTVTTHVRGIYRKLSVHSRGEAVYEALQLGLVEL